MQEQAQTSSIPSVPLFQVRALVHDDHRVLSQWLDARGITHQPALVPPDAFLVTMDGESVAAAWLYASYGVGVAFWEGYVSRPGLTFRLAREVYGVACGCIKRAALARDCRFLRAYGARNLVRFAESNGFVVDSRRRDGLIPLVTFLE